MRRARLAPPRALAYGIVAALVMAAGLALPGTGLVAQLRETTLDRVLAIGRPEMPADSVPPVVVVEIDGETTRLHGPWPWPRETVARLVEAAARAEPATLVLDLLLAGQDMNSPAALARRLGRASARPEIERLAADLPDGDRLLAAALALKPTVGGFVLATGAEAGRPATAPVLTQGDAEVAGLWTAPGAVGPGPDLAPAFAGSGALALPGDPDGTVRRVPLVLSVGGQLVPGLAAEALRVPQAATSYLLRGEPAPALVIGELAVPIGPEGVLRLVPATAAARLRRTVPARDLLAGTGGERLAGAIVLIGVSSPEAGGLRDAIDDILVPSVQIQADALAQILAGRAPLPLLPPGPAAFGVAALLGVATAALGAFAAPALGAALAAATLASIWAASGLLAGGLDRLLDPLAPSAAAAAGFVAAAGSAFAQTRRREAAIRRSFAQHLAPAVVDRIVARPDLVKLAGERREVTTLFTDIEGFTSMTHRCQPEALIAALDHYFEGLAAIVTAHGGMVDKMVGDAIHALFNVPLDLDSHPEKALACAIEIRRWTAAYRLTSEAAALGFGRTRVGLETGFAIVGDVGLRTKLDFTAHGDAVNAAARLEAANKDLGSAVCVGPGCARRCPPEALRPLGIISVRGREGDAMAVSEPWPEDASADWRARYLEAAAIAAADPEEAARRLDALAAERLSDPVPGRFAARIRAAAAAVPAPA